MAMEPTVGDRAALQRLLGGPAMAWFVERVRVRILAADGVPLSGVVRLDAPSSEQRMAAMSLVGSVGRSTTTLRVDLTAVETILRRGPWPAGLADAVTTLSGPVIDRRAQREREASEWRQLSAGLASARLRFPALDPWWPGYCSAGGLKRTARAEAGRSGGQSDFAVAERLTADLATIFESLPRSGVPLAVFAREVLGDAHALDESRPLGRLAANAVAVAFVERGSMAADLPRRDAWAAAGVVLSNVASTVLALGLRGSSGSVRNRLAVATSAALEAMRTARTAMVLTLDQVRSGGVASMPPEMVLHVCENPTIVEVVAARWVGHAGDVADGPMLVCTMGQPSTAVVELIENLTASGASVRYHGDFDWAGLRIARALLHRVAWTPWRFTAADYRAGLCHGRSSLHLTGNRVETPWDPDLADAMAAAGIALEEESVADVLAADLVPENGRGASHLIAPRPGTSSSPNEKRR